jgi:M6 family metalloprotease-like protein
MVNTENYTGYDNVKCTGSVYDYFVDNSLGKFQPQFDVVGPVKLNNYTQYSYGADDYAYLRITKAVIDAVDAQVNFKDYDGDGDGVVDLVFFVFAGNGANYAGNDTKLWWPHRASLYDISNNRSIQKDNVRLYDYASSV